MLMHLYDLYKYSIYLFMGVLQSVNTVNFFLLQEDFDEFDDVDELYISLPLDKVDTLEDLVTIPTSVAVAKVFVYSLLIGCKHAQLAHTNVPIICRFVLLVWHIIIFLP